MPTAWEPTGIDARAELLMKYNRAPWSLRVHRMGLLSADPRKGRALLRSRNTQRRCCDCRPTPAAVVALPSRRCRRWRVTRVRSIAHDDRFATAAAAAAAAAVSASSVNKWALIWLVCRLVLGCFYSAFSLSTLMLVIGS